MDENERIRDINRRDYEGHQSDAVQRLQFQHDFAQSALRTLVLVNGGAIIGLFTFIGNGRAAFDGAGLKCAFAWLVVALFLSMFAYFGAFYSQANYMNASAYAAVASREALGNLERDPNNRRQQDRLRFWGDVCIWLGIGSAFASLGSFALGSWFALSAVTI